MAVFSEILTHGVLIGQGSSAIAVTSAGNSGDVLTSGGAGADPSWVAPSSSGGAPKYSIISKSSNFTANDGSGTIYRISATATVTLPASPADGTVYKFKVTGGTATFAFNGSEKINHADGSSDQSLSLTSNSGVLELVAVTGGWDET